MKCKYWDCGFCYAPVDVETNATQGGCFEPEYCLYRKSQMTNQQLPDIIEIGGVKYQRVEEPKPQTLFEIIREWCDDDNQPTCEELVSRIEKGWLPNEGCHELNSNDYCEGWNDCIEHLKENLK
jgi:hypothetical protein